MQFADRRIKMGFFEEFGENVSDVAKDVTEKAKELGESAKLHTLIKTEELKIQEQYYKLGKRYYSLYCDTADPELIDIIDIISVAQDKIASYKEQLHDKK